LKHLQAIGKLDLCHVSSAADEGLDERLGEMFGDYIAALDSYITFLSRIDAIKAETARR